MNTEYTVDYFIHKFSAIPDGKWCVGKLIDDDGRSCAAGHCGFRCGPLPAECKALTAILGEGIAVPAINDGVHPRYKQPTPKARILQALHDIKSKQEQAAKPPAPKIQQPCCHMWLGMNCVYCGDPQPAVQQPESVIA